MTHKLNMCNMSQPNPTLHLQRIYCDNRIEPQLLMMLEVWQSYTEFVHINTSELRQTASRGQYIKPIAFPQNGIS